MPNSLRSQMIILTSRSSCGTASFCSYSIRPPREYCVHRSEFVLYHVGKFESCLAILRKLEEGSYWPPYYMVFTNRLPRKRNWFLWRSKHSILWKLHHTNIRILSVLFLFHDWYLAKHCVYEESRRRERVNMADELKDNWFEDLCWMSDGNLVKMFSTEAHEVLCKFNLHNIRITIHGARGKHQARSISIILYMIRTSLIFPSKQSVWCCFANTTSRNQEPTDLHYVRLEKVVFVACDELVVRKNYNSIGRSIRDLFESVICTCAQLWLQRHETTVTQLRTARRNFLCNSRIFCVELKPAEEKCKLLENCVT